MLDELRNHDARPTAEEREWLTGNPFTLVLRGIAIAWLLAILGLTAGRMLEGEPAHATTTAAADAAR
jgi:hypothetical protein